MKLSDSQPVGRGEYPRKEIFIYPGEKDQVNFWTKKWGITTTQLNEAILETGSLRVQEIRSYLVNKGFVFSFSRLIRYIKNLRTKNQ